MWGSRSHTHSHTYIFIWFSYTRINFISCIHTYTYTHKQSQPHTLYACVCGTSICAYSLHCVAMPSKVSKTLISFLSTVSNGNVPDVYDCRISLSFLALCRSRTRTFFPCHADTSCSGLTMGLPNRIIRIKVNLRLCWRVCVCVCKSLDVFVYSYVWRQPVSLIKLYSVAMIFMYFEMNGSKLNESGAGTDSAASEREWEWEQGRTGMRNDTRNLIETVNCTNYNNNNDNNNKNKSSNGSNNDTDIIVITIKTSKT